MKRTLELLCVGLVAGAMLTGCPKEKEETPEPTPATNNIPVEEPVVEEPATAAQTAAQAAEPVNEQNYLAALFEKTCVNTKITDTEEQKLIIDEIYARYGFDAETFDAATEQMKGRADIQPIITTRLETCTPELAASFKNAPADGTTAGAAEPSDTKTGTDTKTKTVKKASKAWKSGGYTVKGLSSGNIEGADVRITINDAGKVTGAFQGRREGSAFSIPFQGTIGDDGALTASGNRGQNNLRATGRYKDGQISGALQGSINKQNFRMSYTAK